MIRRNLLLGLVAAPFVVRTPGLLMPVHAMEDLRTIHVRAGEWLHRQNIEAGWTVIVHPGSAVTHCRFMDGSYWLRVLPNGRLSKVCWEDDRTALVTFHITEPHQRRLAPKH